MNEILGIDLLRGHLCLQQTQLNLADRIPADFQSQILWGHLFLALVLWSGEPGLGLRPHDSQGDLQQLRHPARILAVTYRSGATLFPSPSSLPLLLCLLPQILGYKTSLRLVFSWLFRFLVLYFSCNSSLVLEGGNIHLLYCHLGSHKHC